MKQTAVQRLIEQLRFTHKEAYNDLYEVIQQALKMEKQQIEDAHRKGQEHEKDYWNIGDKSMSRHTGNSIKYYKETYED